MTFGKIHAHVSKGNVLMLSEGRVDVDNVYSLREGMMYAQVSPGLFINSFSQES